jgi:4-diphosphocytidyl-2-C-methyl-D-erythritol kinase
LAGSAFSGEDLREMAALLGSDVPFFLSGGAAFVSGRGECIEPVKTPTGLWVVLVKPPFSSDTAGAYALLDQFKASRKAENNPPEVKPSKPALIRALEEEPGHWPFQNDFLPVFLHSNQIQKGEKAPPIAYQIIIESLQKAGASFAGLSGSGSCCFGVFTNRQEGEKLVAEFAAQGIFTRLTIFLAQIAKPVLE